MEEYLYSIQKVGKFNLFSLNKVCNILYLAGKDMSAKYNLQHWNNCYLKDLLIVLLCNIKNQIYIVKQYNLVVATFQINVRQEELCFQKLATNPVYAGHGVGSYCMREIENIAKNLGLKTVVCEVYDKSLHAKEFYEKRGYSVYGTVDTLKYTELKMKKII